MIFLLQWVRTHPQVQSWSIISRTIIVVHTGLLVQILGIEEIRGVPRIVAFFYEHLSKRHIFDTLRYFAIKDSSDSHLKISLDVYHNIS